jgi:hypothetical protein
MPVEHTLPGALHDMNLAKMSRLIIKSQLKDATARESLPARLVGVVGPDSKKQQILPLSFFHGHRLRRSGK